MDKVIWVLLQSHLVPKRKMQRRQTIMELNAKPPKEKNIRIKFARNILRVERKKLLKRQTKGKLESKRREVKALWGSAINTDKKTDLPNDDESIDADVTSRRIR
ncbi:hypothetical protein BDF21DRAFT_483723 [Thamnidium elegans]|nr:hypothetical protein BDF21DRAFT_483723 [Thamnidium elegans]